MAEYKESMASGIKWQRAYRLVIDHPADGTPSVYIYEETCLKDGDDYYRTPISEVLQVVYEPDGTFEIRNPIDDSLTGSQATQSELQVLLYSVVRDAQEKRDIQEAEVNDTAE